MPNSNLNKNNHQYDYFSYLRTTPASISILRCMFGMFIFDHYQPDIYISYQNTTNKYTNNKSIWCVFNILFFHIFCVAFFLLTHITTIIKCNISIFFLTCIFKTIAVTTTKCIITTYFLIATITIIIIR